MSTTTDLMEGVAALLDAAGLGTWDPTGYEPGTPTPIYLRTFPHTAPSRAIKVAHYPLTAFGWETDSLEGVQVVCRAPGPDPTPCDGLADQIRQALHDLQHVAMGGTHVSLLTWQSGANLGQDANGRWETSANFHAITARPARAQ